MLHKDSSGFLWMIVGDTESGLYLSDEATSGEPHPPYRETHPDETLVEGMKPDLGTMERGCFTVKVWGWD